MLLLLIICFVIIILFFMNTKIKTITKCEKNKLIQYIQETQLTKNKYFLQNLNGNYINFNIHNLENGLHFGKEKQLFNFKLIDNYYLITTNTVPTLFLNTNLKGEVKFVINSNLKGNKWIIKKLTNEGILKRLIRKDSKVIPNKAIQSIKNNYGKLPNNINEKDLNYTLEKKIDSSINSNKVKSHLISKDLELIYKKYKFIYKNGFFIQSFYYSYYLSDNKCVMCPQLEDIIIFD